MVAGMTDDDGVPLTALDPDELRGQIATLREWITLLRHELAGRALPSSDAAAGVAGYLGPTAQLRRDLERTEWRLVRLHAERERRRLQQSHR